VKCVSDEQYKMHSVPMTHTQFVGSQEANYCLRKRYSYLQHWRSWSLLV
jgi:hypothetical protein